MALDGEIRRHSKRTIEARRSIVEKLTWFLKQHEHLNCGTLGLRQFLAYLTVGKRPRRWMG